MPSRLWQPVDLPNSGTIIVRAMNHRQADLWIREQPKLLPGQRRFIFASEARNIDGTTPTAIVLLPRWYEHRYATAISGMVERLVVKAGGKVQRINVREAR